MCRWHPYHTPPLVLPGGFTKHTSPSLCNSLSECTQSCPLQECYSPSLKARNIASTTAPHTLYCPTPSVQPRTLFIVDLNLSISQMYQSLTDCARSCARRASCTSLNTTVYPSVRELRNFDAIMALNILDHDYQALTDCARSPLRASCTSLNDTVCPTGMRPASSSVSTPSNGIENVGRALSPSLPALEREAPPLPLSDSLTRPASTSAGAGD